MRSWLVVAGAVAALGGARLAGLAAEAERPHETAAEPYAPSPVAAPIVFVGYREAAADLMWVRFLGYWGSNDATWQAIAGVVDAVIALDPKFKRIYVSGAHAMMIAEYGVGQDTFLHAIDVLERGAAEFPDDYKIPELAAEIYTGDLKTTDPALRRAWDEKGTSWMEKALRKPGAPAWAATWAAHMRTKLGQQQQAIANLREMILLTGDIDARKRMLDKLAELEHSDSAELASEMYAEQHAFESAWHAERPKLPRTMFVLLGARLQPGFDLDDLATGGHDLFGADRDASATSEDDPSSP
ncbi:MAG TPA: hypothetical protein VMJ10_04190 [Kofleriaceae bacterium]|nr:hypothetical protein [Kofleriaceae bacterium]